MSRSSCTGMHWGLFGLVVLLLGIVNLTSAENNIFNGRTPGQCIGGDYHKKHPSNETEPIPLCMQWSANSCCKANTTRDLYNNRETGSEKGWDRCGPISEKCQKYLLAESCFYECEPMLKHYEIPKNPGDVGDVPICGSYCDDWYDACRNDRTCVKNWLYAFYSRIKSTCPSKDQPCMTFGEMYKNGEDMCNSIWWIEYQYEPSNKNCMVMQFTGENPNVYGNPYSSASPSSFSSASPSGSSWLYLLMTMFALLL